MKTILVIGNGFDISHGLPTRYSDFIDFCKYRIQINGGSVHPQKPDSDNRSFSIYFSEKEIAEFDRMVSDNPWVSYLCSQEFDDTWNGVESEIENVCIEIESIFTAFSKIKNCLSFSRNINSHQWNIAKKFCSQLTDEQSYSNLYYEINNIGTKTYESEKQKVINSMSEALAEFKHCFCLFLNIVVPRISVNKNLIIEDICKDSFVYLVNFNYTDTFARLYRDNTLSETHYVHGSAAERNIVIGFNNEITENHEYIRLQKYFQRIQNKTGTDYKTWISMTDGTGTASGRDNQVVFFGHSLSAADADILRELIGHRHTKKIVLYYRSQESYEKQVISLIKLFDKDTIIDWIATDKLIFIKIEEFSNTNEISKKDCS